MKFLFKIVENFTKLKNEYINLCDLHTNNTNVTSQLLFISIIFTIQIKLKFSFFFSCNEVL